MGLVLILTWFVSPKAEREAVLGVTFSMATLRKVE